MAILLLGQCLITTLKSHFDLVPPYDVSHPGGFAIGRSEPQALLLHDSRRECAVRAPCERSDLPVFYSPRGLHRSHGRPDGSYVCLFHQTGVYSRQLRPDLRAHETGQAKSVGVWIPIHDRRDPALWEMADLCPETDLPPAGEPGSRRPSPQGAAQADKKEDLQLVRIPEEKKS